MKTLREYLDAITAWQKANDWGDGTEPRGLSSAEIKETVAASGFKLQLPDSVVALYGWSNGSFDVMPKYSLHDLETALRCGVYLRESRSKVDSEVVGLLPILSDINDDFSGSYCVQCLPEHSADGAVFYVEDEENGGKTKLAYEGVYNLFRTVALAMKKGAILRSDEGLRVKPKMFKEIRRKCNPNMAQVRRGLHEDID